MQQLLFPEILDLTPDDMLLIAPVLDDLRAIGFDMGYGHRLIAPGVVNEQLRIDPKQRKQQILAVKFTLFPKRTPGDIPHGIYPMAL